MRFIFNRKQKMKKGFTLLELLVVIAIIGILSSVVIVSLSSAKNKGNDSSTKAQLSKVRDLAEVFLQTSGAGGYIGFCTSATVGLQTTAVPSALLKSSGATSFVSTFASAGTSSTVTCHETNTAWALSAPLRSETGYWCADSAGASGKETAVLAANSAVCP